jgi:hypothetical protein
MAGRQQHTWAETLILVVGVVQLALVSTVAVRFGGQVDPGRALQVFGVWALGVVLSGIAISKGRRLGWRHLLAIGPGLAVVDVMPKAGAVIVLCVLGVALLHRAHRGENTSPTQDVGLDG